LKNIDKYYTCEQAGQILGVNASRIRQLILYGNRQGGKLKAHKFAKSWAIRAEDLKTFIVKDGRAE
jgi:Helix-turn-helix domain